MKVKLIGCTQFFGVPDELKEGVTDKITEKKQDEGSDGARLIECAGRTCYDSYGNGRESAVYHDHIKQVGHGSVTEHVTINFFITGVSRGLTHELVRHRHANISQRSTRYVDESESDWALHPLIDKYKEQLDAEGTLDTIESARLAYRDIAATLEGCLVADGTDKSTARKQARGAARGLLGNALTSELVWSCNVRSLRNFLEQRASEFADAEIRLLANAIYDLCMLAVPEYFNDYTKVTCPDGIGFGLTTKYRKI
jgi:thymidylate synthase (FAD)